MSKVEGKYSLQGCRAGEPAKGREPPPSGIALDAHPPHSRSEVSYDILRSQGILDALLQDRREVATPPEAYIIAEQETESPTPPLPCQLTQDHNGSNSKG